MLPAARIEEVIAAVTQLEDLKSVRALMDILRTGKTAARAQDGGLSQ